MNETLTKLQDRVEAGDLSLVKKPEPFKPQNFKPNIPKTQPKKKNSRFKWFYTTDATDAQIRLRPVTDCLNNDFFYYLVQGKCNKEKYIDKEKRLNKSRIEYDIIYRLVSIGYTKETIQKVFEAFAHEGSHYKMMKGKPIDEFGTTWFDYEIQKATVHCNHSKTHKFDISADFILNHLHYVGWKSGVRSTLEAILRICKEVGSFEGIHLSTWRVAEKAGCSAQSISNHLKQLTERTIIEKVEESKGAKAAKYNIDSTKMVKSLLHFINEKGIKNVEYAPMPSRAVHTNEDPYHYYCKGKTGATIMKVLVDNVNTRYSVNDLDKLVSPSKPTIRKKLKELVNDGILKTEQEPTNSKPRAVYWIEETSPILDDIAKEKHLFGFGLKKKQKYEELQETWQAKNSGVNLLLKEKHYIKGEK
jgi:DNA-binding HxlR family transcriptional regulator